MNAPPILRPLRAILQRRLQLVPCHPIRSLKVLRAPLAIRYWQSRCYSSTLSGEDSKPDAPSSQVAPEAQEAAPATETPAEDVTKSQIEPVSKIQQASEAGVQTAPKAEAQTTAPNPNAAMMEELMKQFQELQKAKQEREEEERRARQAREEEEKRQQSRILQLEEMLRSLKESQTKQPTPPEVQTALKAEAQKVPEAQKGPEVEILTALDVESVPEVEIQTRPTIDIVAEVKNEAAPEPQISIEAEAMAALETKQAQTASEVEVLTSQEIPTAPQVEAEPAPEVQTTSSAVSRDTGEDLARQFEELLESKKALEDEEVESLDAIEDKEMQKIMEQFEVEDQEPERAVEVPAKSQPSSISKKPIKTVKTTPDGDVGELSRLPRNVQAYYLQPLRRHAKYGVPSCDLQLRSYSIRPLEFYCDFALRAAYYLGLPAHGPVPLPKIIERWTVPKSSFIFKKSQENFERITRRRFIQIRDGHPETVQIWLAFLQKHQHYGVGMKANIWEYSSLDVGKQMDDSIGDAQDAIKPWFMHLGETKSLGTAEKVDEILTDMRYKVAGGR